MSDAPKWIADVLEKLPGAVGPREREALAIEISEEFPVRECMESATASLRAQLAVNGLALPEVELRAVAANMISAIAGAVQNPNAEAADLVAQHVRAQTALERAGVPWGGTLEERVSKLAEMHPLIRDVGREKIDRLRAAHLAFWRAYLDGTIEAHHVTSTDDEEHAFEPYSVDHLAGTCRVCARGIGEHPCKTERDCPEDDTCECVGLAALKELQHAIDDIAGRISP